MISIEQHLRSFPASKLGGARPVRAIEQTVPVQLINDWTDEASDEATRYVHLLEQPTALDRAGVEVGEIRRAAPTLSPSKAANLIPGEDAA